MSEETVSWQEELVEEMKDFSACVLGNNPDSALYQQDIVTLVRYIAESINTILSLDPCVEGTDGRGLEDEKNDFREAMDKSIYNELIKSFNDIDLMAEELIKKTLGSGDSLNSAIYLSSFKTNVGLFYNDLFEILLKMNKTVEFKDKLNEYIDEHFKEISDKYFPLAKDPVMNRYGGAGIEEAVAMYKGLEEKLTKFFKFVEGTIEENEIFDVDISKIESILFLVHMQLDLFFNAISAQKLLPFKVVESEPKFEKIAWKTDGYRWKFLLNSFQLCLSSIITLRILKKIIGDEEK